jgi:cupin fold WbuC family metalloprotein
MKIFTNTFFENLLLSAKKSDRLRASSNVHQSFEDPCQRLFNAVNISSYIRPHRHSLDPKNECLIAIKGLFALIIFSDEGAIKAITPFGSEKYIEKLSIPAGLELSAGVWHTVISLVENSILFEAKAGPFDPAVAKELAPWAPEEGVDNAKEYLEFLRGLSLRSLAESYPEAKDDFLASPGY